MDCSMSGLPVLHHLLELVQTHVHWVSDVIQPVMLRPLSSVVPFSSCLQSFPASQPFPMSQLFASGGQSIGASASVLPMNIQDWFPLGWTGLISLQSKGLSRVFSNPTVWKRQFFRSSAVFRVQLSHPHMTAGKLTAFTARAFVSKVMPLLLIYCQGWSWLFFQGARVF